MLRDGIVSRTLDVKAFEADSPSELAAELKIWLQDRKDPIYQITFLQDVSKIIAMVLFRERIS